MTRRGVYAKGVAKRQEILETALEVVAAQGYRNASVRDIAEAANLSPAGLLHYFGSKEDLFVAIIQERDAKDGLRAPEVDFMTQFLTVMRENSKVPGLVYLYSLLSVEAADPDHPAHTYFVARRNMVTQLATEVIKGAHRGHGRGHRAVCCASAPVRPAYSSVAPRCHVPECPNSGANIAVKESLMRRSK
ncbi:helix-turn-helix domain-containing protein [Timonella senegalensis]|uniref:TetR/AcrR family transcriptional regulator n=1 Tax=Timonella senegalensis TaxID=1465825 RepID=UPI002FE166CE